MQQGAEPIRDLPPASLPQANGPTVVTTSRDSSSLPHTPVNRRRSTIVNLSFQYGSLTLTLVHGILMVPLYLRFIDEGLYGAWLASGNVLYLAAIAQGGATYLLAQRTAQQFGERNIRDLGETIGSGLLLLVSLSTVVAVIIGALIPFIPTWFKVVGENRSQLTTSLLLMIPAIWLRLQIMGISAIEQGLQRPFGVGVAAISTGAVHLAVTVLLLVLGFGLLAIPLAILLREVLCIIPLVWLLARSKRALQIRIRVSGCALKSLSRLSIWTFLTFLNDALTNGTSLLLVGLILGKEKVPIVTVSRAAWEILALVLRHFLASVQPSLAHFRGETAREQAGRIANQVLLIVIAGASIGIAGIVALNAPFVALWINARFYAGGLFNYLYAAAAICDIVAVAVCQLSLSLGEIRSSSIVQTIALVIRVALLIALLPVMGVLALPISIIGGVLISSLLLARLWLSSTGVSRVSFAKWCRAIAAILVGLAIGYLGHMLVKPTNWKELTVAAVILALISSTITMLLEPSLIAIAKQTFRGTKPFRIPGDVRS